MSDQGAAASPQRGRTDHPGQRRQSGRGRVRTADPHGKPRHETWPEVLVEARVAALFNRRIDGRIKAVPMIDAQADAVCR